MYELYPALMEAGDTIESDRIRYVKRAPKSKLNRTDLWSCGVRYDGTVIRTHLALVLVLEVVEAVAALPLAPGLEVGQEVVIGRVAATHLLHGDELLVLDEEDTVAVPEKNIVEGFDNCSSLIINSRLVLLDLLKDILAVVGNCYSR